MARKAKSRPSADDRAEAQSQDKSHERLAASVSNHHPAQISLLEATELVEHGISSSSSSEMIVLAADIRKSTFLMKEAANFVTYAKITGDFVEAAAKLIRDHGGWFDKFTGDGFLGYWITERGKWSEPLNKVLPLCQALLHMFQEVTLPAFRRNSKNFPKGVGLSLGLDAGETHFAMIANELTIVGPSVVGAVRMVSCANPWEAVANVYLGETLYENRGQFVEHDLEVRREFRATKEYEEQEVYPMTFKR